MAQDRTAGFDMLVQVSEAELNTQLAAAFLGGTIFPPSLSIPVSMGARPGQQISTSQRRRSTSTDPDRRLD